MVGTGRNHGVFARSQRPLGLLRGDMVLENRCDGFARKAQRHRYVA